MSFDKILHAFVGGGLFLSITLAFGGAKEARKPAYLTVGIAAIAKEAYDEISAPKRNNTQEHLADLIASLWGAAVIDVGVQAIRGNR